MCVRECVCACARVCAQDLRGPGFKPGCSVGLQSHKPVVCGEAGSPELPLPLVPAPLRPGQDRGAGGEQRPPGEAPGEDEGQPQRALVPAVAPAGGGGPAAGSPALLHPARGPPLPLLLSSRPVATQRREPSSLRGRRPPVCRPRPGWAPPPGPAGHAISTLGPGNPYPPVHQPPRATYGGRQSEDSSGTCVFFSRVLLEIRGNVTCWDFLSGQNPRPERFR